VSERTRILILGFGALGAALVRLFGSSYDFRGVKRRPVSAPPCPVYSMPIADPGLADHLAWADHLIFCPAPSSSDIALYRATYLDNMTSLLSLLRARSRTPRSIILISSTGVYPESTDAVIDETCETVAETERQDILLRTERALRDSPIPFVIFRCGGLYGEGRDTYRSRLAGGRITSAALSRQYVHFIHLADVCTAIDLAIRHRVRGEIFNLVDDSEIRRVDFYRFLSSLYGIPIPEAGAPPVVRHDRRISNVKMKSRLGLSLASPRVTDYLRTGMLQSIS